MSFEIRNGRLLGAQFVNANASGGTLKPTLIILHDTAGRLEKGSSVSWFKSKDCNPVCFPASITKELRK